jgi:hypothetical protein
MITKNGPTLATRPGNVEVARQPRDRELKG